MFKGNNSESILILKEKFSEIKRNISLIEEKQAQFFNQTRRVERADHSLFKRNDPIQRPSSVSRCADQQKSFMHSFRGARRDKKSLVGANEDLIRANERQRQTIKTLSEENQRLREEVQRLKSEKKPPPCIKHSGSTPKKHRVAFSKDLVQVVNENEGPDDQREHALMQTSFEKKAHKDYLMKYHPDNKHFKKHFYSTSPISVPRKDWSFEQKRGFGTIRNEESSTSYYRKNK